MTLKVILNGYFLNFFKLNFLLKKKESLVYSDTSISQSYNINYDEHIL